jgi:hypothetical protein
MWKLNRLGFGCLGAATNVHLKNKRAKLRKYVFRTRDEVITRVEVERAIVREEGGPELKGRGIPLAVRIPAHVDAAFAGLELGSRHAAGPLWRLHRRLHEEEESTGPLHEPCRTPMVLFTFEYIKVITQYSRQAKHLFGAAHASFTVRTRS